ncbi:hypothetical protein [Paraburkholderia tropica]|uniref:hypothetical protein n=1 Tax=Paraburkholderia tropica TaxID=92647 RepID=UPI000AE6DB96|nr:hypothetical protein [Paraburkholderia tropica]MBB2980124.1 hypothetical protein [Paraburkholderia tropica]QNB16295.1 hypothetical protein G5S35_32195 [Paraburkholderia tropica]RQM44039.1 hypothetical protein EHZ19_30930 [Paraburkholderia bannensis]RQN35914.1 hypothetical protein EHZ25_27570 [Paraburkholderia tropica]
MKAASRQIERSAANDNAAQTLDALSLHASAPFRAHFMMHARTAEARAPLLARHRHASLHGNAWRTRRHRLFALTGFAAAD